MTTTGVTAAVIGTGFMATTHVEALRRLGVAVRGIAGSSAAKSRAAADALGLALAYDDLAAVLADDAVDAVHLTVPNRWHYPMAKAALAAGKHVLCEKPLAMDSRESGELVELAKASGRAAGVNYNIRFYPLNLEAGSRVRSGDLGRLFHVTGSYVQDWLLHEADYNWRVLAAEGGRLRAVADIGTHWLDLIHAITGLEVEALCADLQTVHPQRIRPDGEIETFKGKEQGPAQGRPVAIETEDYGCIMLRFVGGARGSLHVSQTTAGRKNRLQYELAAANGALAWDSESPDQLWIGHRDRPNELLLRDPALVGPSAATAIGYPGGHNEGFPDTFKACFDAFYRYIEHGDLDAPMPFPSFADGHREIRLCEAILASHDRAGWIDLESTP